MQTRAEAKAQWDRAKREGRYYCNLVYQLHNLCEHSEHGASPAKDAKSLEETLKDLRAGGYSEGGIRNWLVNKGFPSAKVDRAMAVRSTTDRRARLHRALDCVLDARATAKDAKADGTYSPDEEADERILIGRVKDAVAKWRDEAWRIGGNFRGPGIWSRVKQAMKG
jgi:hypothetical protein